MVHWKNWNIQQQPVITKTSCIMYTFNFRIEWKERERKYGWGKRPETIGLKCFCHCCNVSWWKIAKQQ